MPKCVHSGCDQTAFYGQQFGHPMFCKAHTPVGTGSVRRKCKYGECPNAVFDAADLCQRCREVKGNVDAFAKSKFEELDRTIAQEVISIMSRQRPTGPPTSTLPSRQEVVPNNIFSKPTSSVAQPFAPPVASVTSTVPTASTTPVPKKSGPKIVRTPEEPKSVKVLAEPRPPTDSSLAKKRAQTPGRPKAVAEVKGDM